MKVRLILAALGLLVGAVVGEAGLRLYAALVADFRGEIGTLDPMAVLIEPHGGLGYRQKPNSTFRYARGWATSNAMGFRGPMVQVSKPPGTFRIVLLGGSATHGWGVLDDETIDAHMRDILRRRFPTVQFEVVNLAFDGYDSYQLFERLRSDGLALDPDVVVVNTGINDVRNAQFSNLKEHDPRTLIWEGVLQRLRAEQQRGGPSLWSRVKHHSYLARSGAFVRRRLKYQPQPDLSSRARVTPNPEAIDYFERNLRRIADLVANRPVVLLFSAPPSALAKWYDPQTMPERGYWVVDAATTQQYREKLAERMKDVVVQLKSEGRRVDYVGHLDFDRALFLDDAHLTPEGNRQMASDFADAVTPYVVEKSTGSAVSVRG